MRPLPMRRHSNGSNLLDGASRDGDLHDDDDDGFHDDGLHGVRLRRGARHRLRGLLHLYEGLMDYLHCQVL